MKLEYLYNNNNNLKHTIKAFSFIGICSILFCFLRIVIGEEHVNYSLFLLISFGIIVFTVICNIVSALIILLWNNYKRKQFFYIKNNGSYYEGEIIMANYHHKGYSKHNWIEKSSGDILVCVNDKTYKISDIDYNNEFKKLEQRLKDNFNTTKQKIIDNNYYLKNTGTLRKLSLEKITIEIYLLEDKVIADLNSIKIN